MALSYEFSVGSVRARENTMLSGADIEQMLSCKNEGELVAYLKDKGYGSGKNINEIIDSNARKMWKYIKSVAPDMELFNPFLFQNDIHNLKTVLKGIMSDTEYENLLILPCTVNPEDLKNAVENRRFDKLPEWLSDSADNAYGLLAETKDARLSDAVIDRAVMEKLILEGKRSRSVFLSQYFERLVFYADIKIALRAARTGATRNYLERAVCICDGLEKDKIIFNALQGYDTLLKYLEKLSVYECDKAVELYKKSPSEFERFVDNGFIRLAKQLCRLSSEGPEPLLGYYTGCEYERKLINIIAGGIKTKTPPDKIRERLRETYG